MNHQFWVELDWTGWSSYRLICKLLRLTKQNKILIIKKPKSIIYALIFSTSRVKQENIWDKIQTYKFGLKFYKIHNSLAHKWKLGVGYAIFHSVVQEIHANWKKKDKLNYLQIQQMTSLKPVGAPEFSCLVVLIP